MKLTSEALHDDREVTNFLLFLKWPSREHDTGTLDEFAWRTYQIITLRTEDGSFKKSFKSTDDLKLAKNSWCQGDQWT